MSRNSPALEQRIGELEIATTATHEILEETRQSFGARWAKIWLNNQLRNADGECHSLATARLCLISTRILVKSRLLVLAQQRILGRANPIEKLLIPGRPHWFLVLLDMKTGTDLGIVDFPPISLRPSQVTQ